MEKVFQDQMARRKTPRLFLRVIGQDDLADVFATMNYQHTAEIISFLSWPMKMAQAQKMVDKAVAGWQRGQEFMYLARRQDNNAIVGFIGLHRRDAGVAEIGYWVCDEQQGQGFAAEMANSMIEAAFRILDCNKVYATVAYGNQASARVLEKSGMVLAGTKDVVLPDGGVRPSQLYERTQ